MSGSISPLNCQLCLRSNTRRQIQTLFLCPSVRRSRMNQILFPRRASIESSSHFSHRNLGPHDHLNHFIISQFAFLGKRATDHLKKKKEATQARLLREIAILILGRKGNVISGKGKENVVGTMIQRRPKSKSGIFSLGAFVRSKSSNQLIDMLQQATLSKCPGYLLFIFKRSHACSSVK